MSDVTCNGCDAVLDQSDMCSHDCPGDRVALLEARVAALVETVHGLQSRVNVLEGREPFDGMP